MIFNSKWRRIVRRIVVLENYNIMNLTIDNLSSSSFLFRARLFYCVSGNETNRFIMQLCAEFDRARWFCKRRIKELIIAKGAIGKINPASAHHLTADKFSAVSPIMAANVLYFRRMESSNR